MRAYLDAMDKAPYTGKAVDTPRILAALGPQMLKLAAERSLGAHPYFVPVEHTTTARKTIGSGPLLAVEQAAELATEPAGAPAPQGARVWEMARLRPRIQPPLKRRGPGDRRAPPPPDPSRAPGTAGGLPPRPRAPRGWHPAGRPPSGSPPGVTGPPGWSRGGR